MRVGSDSARGRQNIEIFEVAQVNDMHAASRIAFFFTKIKEIKKNIKSSKPKASNTQGYSNISPSFLLTDNEGAEFFVGGYHVSPDARPPSSGAREIGSPWKRGAKTLSSHLFPLR